MLSSSSSIFLQAWLRLSAQLCYIWRPEPSQPHSLAAARAKLLQLCPTLCDPVDCSPSGSFAHGILQGRILEWVAMPSSRGSAWPRDWTCISYVSCRWVLYHSASSDNTVASTQQYGWSCLILWSESLAISQMETFLGEGQLGWLVAQEPRPALLCPWGAWLSSNRIQLTNPFQRITVSGLF